VRARRAQGDRGAVLVEAAFVLPVLVALVMGIIDFGFSFNDWISVRQGGRDGLRQVIVSTAPPSASGSWNCNHGTFSSTSPFAASSTDLMAMDCFTKARVGLDDNKTAVSVYFATPFKAGQPVKVCVRYQTGSTTGFYNTILSGKVLGTEVESLIEQDSTTLSPFQESTFHDGTATNFPTSCSSL